MAPGREHPAQMASIEYSVWQKIVKKGDAMWRQRL
jgi:hypothetical protein